MKKPNKTEEILRMLLKSQQLIYDNLQFIIYNQSPNKKQRLAVTEDTMRKLEKRYNL